MANESSSRVKLIASAPLKEIFRSVDRPRHRMLLSWLPRYIRAALAVLALLANPGLLSAQPENLNVPHQPPPKFAPQIKSCTQTYWIPQDGSWGWKPFPDGMKCTVGAKTGTCQGGCCNACQVPTAAGTLFPTYVVVGLVYSPPGCTGCQSNASVVEYTEANTVGTTLPTENSFNQDYSLTVGVTGILGGGSAEVSGDWTTTQTSSTSQTISNTQQSGLKATGNQDGINHDQDTFIVLLNPSVSVDSGESFQCSATGGCAPAIEWRSGVDGPASQPYPLTVQDLKNFGALPTNVANLMQAHGITQEDFKTILSLDPFANGPAAIDGTRYVRTTHTFPYKPPDKGECNNSGVCTCVVMSSQKTNNELTSNTTSTKTSYAVGLKQAATFGPKGLLNLTVTATQKFTWTATASQTNLTSSFKSANLTIPCPSSNWTAAEDYTQIDVYWDTWYGSFMFAPTVVLEKAAGSNTFVSGHIVDKAGQPLRHEPVHVTVGAVTYHTLTDSKGDYAVYGVPVTKNLQTQKSPKATAHVRAQTYKVVLGSQTNAISLKYLP